MKRLVLLLVALVLGCDDPVVSAKALDVLEHGFVEAQLICDCSLVCNSSPVGYEYSATLLVDGACVARSSSLTDLWPRSDARSATCQARDGAEVEDGELRDDNSSCVPLDVTTCCTGFNLEAFGVE